ncbi:MAG: hypothetical protein ISS79_04295 [Phycisphaerae bacterium]|nr:hypothetical protein [Phycisphaerae bacterium]
MKCITCGEDAVAICQFCGRVVRQGHIQEDVFISGFSAKTGFWNMQENAVGGTMQYGVEFAIQMGPLGRLRRRAAGHSTQPLLREVFDCYFTEMLQPYQIDAPSKLLTNATGYALV